MLGDYKPLGKLIADAQVRYVRHFRNVGINGVADDSRAVRPGNLFMAVRGEDQDGHRYIADAVARGAKALVVENAGAAERTGIGQLPLVVVEDGRSAVARIAAAFYGHPARRLRTVGITGTNGKTTISYIIRSIFEMAGTPAGLVGTTGYYLGSEFEKAPTTTPGPLQLQALLARMVQMGLGAAVLEVSSHALVQKRALGLDFDAAVFSNLRSDHMDYHRTSSAYLKAKGILFQLVREGGVSVLNADDWASMVYASQARAHALFYSRRMRADLNAEVKSAGLWGTEACFRWKGRDLPVTVGLPGMHNVENASAAALATLALGVDPRDVAAGIARVDRVPGRLEPVPTDEPFDVFVDYAHTDDALEAVCRNLAERKTGRLILVFGCGGDRDRAKRPRMARTAENHADFSFVTSDNPRTEEPMAVIQDIVSGFRSKSSYLINPDRSLAIESALQMARAGDIVLIAGKGHETYQEIQGERVPFDDREIARAVLEVRSPGPEETDEYGWLDDVGAHLEEERSWTGQDVPLAAG